jgi:hypothetical protein
MHRMIGATLLMLAPVLVLSSGCGGGTPPKPTSQGTQTGGPKTEPEKKVELAFNGKWGKLTGKVTYDGMPPEAKPIREDLQKPECHKDAPDNYEAGKVDTTWLVSKDGGVANVLIYLKAPKNTYFPIHDEDKNRKDTVTVDQPHCAFLPRIAVLYPEYFDGKERKRSGQKFKILNNATFTHNFQWKGQTDYGNDGGNYQMAPKSEKAVDINYQSQPINFNCDIHKFMVGQVWTFDHPYAVSTKKDGTFEIPRVPAGAEIAVIAWHEAIGELTTEGFEGKDGKKMTFMEGENKLNFKIKAK